MSSSEPNKYEERRDVPSTSMYPEKWRPSWWTRRALLGTAAVSVGRGAQRGTFDITINIQSSALIDPSDYFRAWYSKDGPQNFSMAQLSVRGTPVPD